MKLFDWMFVPRRWRNFLIGVGLSQIFLGFYLLKDDNLGGWVNVAEAVGFFSFALRTHDRMTK